MPAASASSRNVGDALQLDASRQKQVEATLGCVYVEVSEMAGYTHACIDRLKAYLSTRIDNGVRLAYRRNPALQRGIAVAAPDCVALQGPPPGRVPVPQRAAPWPEDQRQTPYLGAGTTSF